jgi:putative transposase
VRDRAAAVEPEHAELSVCCQCELLGISRTAYYYEPKRSEDDRDFAVLLAILDELKEHPFYGYRKIALAVAFMDVTRKQVRRIMKRAGLRAIYPGKRLSMPNKGHKKYPYLLRGKNIWLPNQVWASDITYIKLPGGHVYLVTIIDLYSRRIMSWRVSNTLDADFCVLALEEAIACHGSPAIFNTDQGCQFTSEQFVSVLQEYGIQISMDGVNRALDNIFVERFWRTLKYEDIYIRGYATIPELKVGLEKYFHFYNTERFHESLEYKTPEEIYFGIFSSTMIQEAA